jgi:hypothetical protein
MILLGSDFGKVTNLSLVSCALEELEQLPSSPEFFLENRGLEEMRLGLRITAASFLAACRPASVVWLGIADL